MAYVEKEYKKNYHLKRISERKVVVANGIVCRRCSAVHHKDERYCTECQKHIMKGRY